jgi:hypothetical protein
MAISFSLNKAIFLAEMIIGRQAELIYPIVITQPSS